MTKQRTMRGRILPGIVSAGLLFFSVWGALFLTSINYAGGAEWPDSTLWLTIGGRGILLALAMTATCFLFVCSVLRSRRMGDTTKGLLTIPVALLLCLFALEFAFMFVPRSHGYGGSLSSRIWTSYYWHPVNELGYRSPSVIPPDKGIRTVLVLGDSFTEGHGIDDIGDRYPELLEPKLGRGYRVFNVGLSGADSSMEFANLLAYPVSSDILVLQYFGNDIEYTCQEQGLTFGNFQPYKGLGKATTFIAKNSFLANFIYWLLPRTEEDARYAEFLIDCYQDDEILASHLSVLNKFVDYARERQIPFFVVMFPFLEPGTDAINAYVPLITGYFAQQSITVISVAELIQNLSPSERMVNTSDGHASERVHALVAEALYSAMRSN